MTAPSPTGTLATQCSALVHAVPDDVAGQARRGISPASGYAAAWGDPAIVLTCGGAAPAALRPTSQCFVVDGVGWLATQRGRAVDTSGVVTGEIDFTTIGRSAYVEVDVPGAYQPAADALANLAAAVKQQTAQLQPCH